MIERLKHHHPDTTAAELIETNLVGLTHGFLLHDFVLISIMYLYSLIHLFTYSLIHFLDTKIRDTVGKRDEDGKVIPYDTDMSTAQATADEQAYLDTGRKFYARPLIDYDMALFLAPMEMAGAVMGVIIQKLLPNWFFLSLAGIVLGFTAYKTYTKFFAAYKKDKENREKRRLADEAPVDGVEEGGEGFVSNEGVAEIQEFIKTSVEGSINEATGEGEEDKDKLKLRRELLEQDRRQFPIEKVLYLFILWIGLAFIIFLKGGKGVDSIIGITCSSPWYAVLIACQFLWLLGFAGLFGYRIVKGHKEKVACDYPFHQNDVLWDGAKLRFYSFFTFIAGVVAGLIGIGGGMI